MRIAIGSTNPVKFRAAQAVLAPLYPNAEFFALEVESGVHAQPWGNGETRLGAIQRARNALAQSGGDFGVGFEGGVMETDGGLMLCNWAAIVDRGQRLGVGNGGGPQLPAVVAELLKNGGELGPAMDALTGEQNVKHHEGAVGILTRGLINRQSAFEYTLTMALAPFRSPDWFNDSQGERNHENS